MAFASRTRVFVSRLKLNHPWQDARLGQGKASNATSYSVSDSDDFVHTMHGGCIMGYMHGTSTGNCYVGASVWEQLR